MFLLVMVYNMFIWVQVHLLTENIVKLGMFLLRFGLPLKLVDTIALALGRLVYGDVSEYGLRRPTKGPFFLKATTGRSPTIDVGSVPKIKSGEMKVCITYIH